MSTHAHASKPFSTKETLTGLVIAFALAFVFRGFVIEGFVIPTGSMAPTLLGKHVLVTNPDTGSVWPVGPWMTYPGSAEPVPLQPNPRVTDPAAGTTVTAAGLPLRAGDRIFVLKYLPGLFEPKRWDTAVFKNPGDQQNFIKRLVGLPGEQLCFVDGDLFTRPFVDGVTLRTGADAWRQPGWHVQRKPERVQRALLRPIADSSHAPREPGPGYTGPWTTDDPSRARWEGLDGSPSYRYTGEAQTSLRWRRPEQLSDFLHYNEMSSRMPVFPVADLAASFGIEPQNDSVSATAVLTARGHLFRAELRGGRAILSMRPDDGEPDGAGSPWTTLDDQPAPALAAGRVTNVEFWHIDQALWLFVDGSLVAGGPEAGAYDLSPAQRAEAATGRTLDDLLADTSAGTGRADAGIFSRPEIYRRPNFRWQFEGGPFSLHRVRMDRDISYQISPEPTRPTRGGHPENFPTLAADQFFMCGDNSAASLDSRLWRLGEGSPDPWVAAEVDPKVRTFNRRLMTPDQQARFDSVLGTVHRDLMIGKAFVVYFPAPNRLGRIPVPDAGRVRWIW
jgi:signal peptidase I